MHTAPPTNVGCQSRVNKDKHHCSCVGAFINTLEDCIIQTRSVIQPEYHKIGNVLVSKGHCASILAGDPRSLCWMLSGI